jgi:hypothetical protein
MILNSPRTSPTSWLPRMQISLSILLSAVQIPPEFTVTPGDLEVTEGEDVSLEVRARGKPLPRMAWYRDSKAVKAGKHYALDTGETGQALEVAATLSIRDIVPEVHDGMYSVEARNAAGKIVHDVNLLGEQDAMSEPSLLCIYATITI